MRNWSVLKSDVEYNEALGRIDQLLARQSSKVRDKELELLALLVEDYEEKNYPFPDTTPVEVVVFMMNMRGLSQQDLVPAIGSKSHVSRILSGQRSLNVPLIIKFSKLLGIPAASLLPKVPEQIEP